MTEEIASRFGSAFSQCPVVAIIRGVEPSNVIEVGDALFEAGIRVIEVPLNSPRPFESIEKLSHHFKDRAIIGAGTVLNSDEVAAVAKVGGEICVSPNVNNGVIEATLSVGMISMPGIYTATEAFTAIAAGARMLKLFPASTEARENFKAMKAVLPKEVGVLAVGGVSHENVAECLRLGFAGIGVGSEFYKPGRPADEIRKRAQRFIAAMQVGQS